jgi:hypothetical protein
VMTWHPNKRGFPRETPHFSNSAFSNLRAAECIEADPGWDERNSGPCVWKFNGTASSHSIPHAQMASCSGNRGRT